jgi:hypothetical protein
LHSAIAENKAAYNLPNAFIDQFEDDTGLDAQTDCDRVSEYMSSVISVTVDPYDIASYGFEHRNQDATITNGGTRFNQGNALGSGNWGNSQPCVMTVPTYNTPAGENWPTGVHTIILTSLQENPANGVNAFIGLYKNAHLSPPYNTPTTLNSGFGNYQLSGNYPVGQQVKFVWDYDDPNVISSYRRDSSSAAWSTVSTGINYKGSNWDSIGTPTTIFWGLTANSDTSDTGRYWKYDIAGTRTYGSTYAAGNFTSASQTAQSTVSTMGAVILYKNNAGTASLNTDLVCQLSADGGSNYTTATLEAGGTFSSGISIAKVNGLTIGTSGTAPKYKISFANQSEGVKETQVHGVALLY